MRSRAGVLVGGLALMAVLAGCQGEPVQVGGSSSPSQSPPGSEASQTTSGPSDEIDSSHLLTVAEVQRRYSERLREEATSLGLTAVPDVQLVRFVRPDEAPSMRVPCLQDLGIPAEAIPEENGYSIGDVPASQGKAANEAQYICEAKYPLHPQYELKPSAATLGRQYDWMVSTQVPCMKVLGYSISEPPSKEVWIASRANGEVWGPDLDVAKVIGRDQAKMRSVYKACPQPGVNDLIEHPPSLAPSP